MTIWTPATLILVATCHIGIVHMAQTTIGDGGFLAGLVYSVSLMGALLVAYSLGEGDERSKSSKTEG